MAYKPARLAMLMIGWATHALGLLLLLAGVSLFAAAWWAGMAQDAPGTDFTSYGWSQRDGEHFQGVRIMEGGRFSLTWGSRRAKVVPQPVKTVTEYIRFGRWELRNPGWLESGYVSSAATTPEGKPLLEYTAVDVRWQFIAFVGAALAMIPLVVSPIRRAIAGTYRRMTRLLMVPVVALTRMIPGGKSRRRGFEVIPRQ